MMTIKLFSKKFESVPAATSWYLANLGEARGKQELYTRQSPQRLKALREHALIESAVSSNRIEGVVVDQSRIATIVFGKPLLRDRDEEEVRGYRQALTLIHEQGANLPVSQETILQLHRLTRGEIWDAGKYKDKDGDIIEKFPDGRSRVRFKTVSAAATPASMKVLLDIYHEALRERIITPPATGWFIGRYKAVFHLNGKEQGNIGFTVSQAKVATTTPPAYRTFSSPDHGFSIQYPAGWVEGEKGKSSVACMFLANADNSPVSSLNVQVVPVTGAGDSRSKEAINLIAQQLIDQITGVLKGRIRNDTWTTAGILTGRELDSEYAYQGAKIRQRQFLTYRANTVFVLVLTADERVYGSVVGHYLNAAKTLQFYAK